ncbi:MAG: GNAT family N-acetyltransferase [Anaerovoracaceae bacterium]|jgi:GNAT superfamily N-acetyltransferase
MSVLFDTFPVLLAGCREELRLNKVRVLEEPGDVMLYQSPGTGLLMSAALDPDREIRVLKQHTEVPHPLVVTNNKETAAFIKDTYGLDEILPCRTTAILNSETGASVAENTDRPAGSLGADLPFTIRPAALSDLDFIYRYYQVLPKDLLSDLIRKDHLVIAEQSGRPAGFAGRHAEGSLGLLEVLPEYRRRGLATMLEQYFIRKIRGAGEVPYCYVAEDNEASLALQRKVGMAISDELFYWCTPGVGKY